MNLKFNETIKKNNKVVNYLESVAQDVAEFDKDTAAKIGKERQEEVQSIHNSHTTMNMLERL